jgi:Na+/proline symporter
VGGERVGIVVFVATVTAIYTAYGGLLVSILTDRAQVCVCVCGSIRTSTRVHYVLAHLASPLCSASARQAMLSLVLIAVASVYLALSYKPSDFQRPLPANLGVTHAGRWVSRKVHRCST